MTTRTIRIFVVLALVSILGIVVTQVYWFKQAFDANEQEFNANVHIALKEVVKGILRYNNTGGVPADPVKQPERNAFVVMVNDQINPEVLEYLLVRELKKFNVNQSFEFGIYDCANRKMVTGRYVEGDQGARPAGIGNAVKWNGDNYYFTVYFPHKVAGIFGSMSLWIFSSAVLCVVVTFFGYSLFVILKQRRLSEIQRDFINNMTHEIRTPLATIAISAETLRQPDITSSPQRLLNYATIIADETAKLKGQVERVLSVANPDSRIKLNFEVFDLHEVIRDTAERLVQHASSKSVSLEYKLNAASSQIRADKLHISNLVSNLVDNSLKYSREKVCIAIASVNQGDQIEVCFSDDGIGIGKEHLKKIFDKFYRVPNGNIHNVKGFGIGLNYVQLIARMHKGQVRVSAIPEQGASFRVILPVA